VELPFVWANGRILAREARVRPGGELGVFETCLWTRAGTRLLDHHRARLERGRAALDLRRPLEWELGAAGQALLEANGVDEAVLRFEVRREGSFASLRTPPDDDASSGFSVVIASTPLGDAGLPGNHKTNRRAFYERALCEARAAGADEALLLNSAGGVADGSRTNLFVVTAAGVLTPDLKSGGVAGVVRRWLLDGPAAPTLVAHLEPDVLFAASEILLSNAVRGVIGVTALRHDARRSGLPGAGGPVAREWAQRWATSCKLQVKGSDWDREDLEVP
jgi:branched-subunit amino acid aminotransferase/4-amino-4-deoxychorismate lyase